MKKIYKGIIDDEIFFEVEGKKYKEVGYIYKIKK